MFFFCNHVICTWGNHHHFTFINGSVGAICVLSIILNQTLIWKKKVTFCWIMLTAFISAVIVSKWKQGSLHVNFWLTKKSKSLGKRSFSKFRFVWMWNVFICSEITVDSRAVQVCNNDTDWVWVVQQWKAEFKDNLKLKWTNELVQLSVQLTHHQIG